LTGGDITYLICCLQYSVAYTKLSRRLLTAGVEWLFRYMAHCHGQQVAHCVKTY